MTTGTNPLAGRSFVDEGGSPVVPGGYINEGGEGWIYTVDGDPDAVVKVWKPGRTPDDADAKLRYLVANPVTPELGANWRITWPQHIVLENGAIAGYVMPKLDYTLPWIPIVEYYNRSAARGTGADQSRSIQIDDRVRIASNLALGYRAVHAAGYVIGDINEKNAEANRQNDVALMDCDSYGFTDATGRSFSNNMGRPEFQAPEAQNNYANRTQEQDRFALAVLIFQLLTGYHPYTITGQHAQDYPLPGERISAWLFPPAGRGLTAPDPYNEAWETLTDKQKDLFLRCFDEQHKGQPRPTPEEWVEALMEIPAVPAPAPSPSRPPSPAPTPGRPAPAPSPSRSPSPAPTPGRPAPGPRRYYTPPGAASGDWLYFVPAVAGYGALIPLMFFNQFRPFWWLGLLLLAGALFYLPVRRLLQPPITATRWVLIGVASLVSVWFLLALIDNAMSVWPWWLWLGLGLGTALILLVPARGRLLGSLRSPNPRQRWVAIGGVSLLALFILAGMGSAVFREWEDWRWRRSLEASSGVTAGAAAPVVAPETCGSPTNFVVRGTPGEREFNYSWEAPAGGLTVTGYVAEFRMEESDGNLGSWMRDEQQLGVTENAGSTAYSSHEEGQTAQFRVYAMCDDEISEPSDVVEFVFPVVSPGAAEPAAAAAEPVCGQPTNFRAGALNTSDRSLIYSWDAPARSDLTVTGYRTESREVLGDGTYTDWRSRGALSAGEIYQAVGPFSSDIDGRTFQNRVYALCDSVYSEPSGHVLFTYPAAIAAVVPTDTPAPTPTPAPEPTDTPIPTDTPAPTATPIPPSTPTPAPLATRTPTQWLVQHPADPKITGASPGTHLLLQGCYLGAQTSDRRFRLASWDVWDPSRYGNELKFVKIITNTGARLTLEPGSCYEATVVKQTDSHEEYVCLDQGSTHPHQTPCANPREHEIIPTFILHPNSPDDPDNYSRHFSVLTTPTLRPPR